MHADEHAGAMHMTMTIVRPGLFFQREGPGSEPGNSLLCPDEAPRSCVPCLRDGEVGLRGSERTEHGEEHSNEFSPQKVEPILVHAGFSPERAEVHCGGGGDKQWTPVSLSK